MWFSFSSWCNWLHANSHFETKECFHNCKLFFLRGEVMEFAATSNGWSSKVVLKCICWHAKFYEWFPKFIIFKPLLKKFFSSLFNSKDGFQNGISITSWGGKGYSFLPWFMILWKQTTNMKHIILKVIFNIQLYRWRSVMENVFKILKRTFKKLLVKSNLHVIFLPNVVSCCYMLQNLILDGRDVNIDALMLQLEQKNQ